VRLPCPGSPADSRAGWMRIDLRGSNRPFPSSGFVIRAHQ
jgi:hypothetical protein